jgi:3',5'-cyclic AMP phosphodiesterase CpdA
MTRPTDPFATQVAEEYPKTMFLEPAERRLILHCSDIHVGRRFKELPAERLVAAAKRLEPDAIVISGDLTMRARTLQFMRARSLIEKLPHPLVIIPGNHDIPLYNVPLRLVAPFWNYRFWISDLHDGVLDLGICAVWAANTINPFVHQKGLLRERELNAIEEWAAALPSGIWRVLVVHQHFHNMPGNPRPGIYRKPAELLERLSNAGIHLVLHGHVHQSCVYSSRDVCRAMKRQVIIAAAGTVSSGRTRGGQDRLYQFNTIEFTPESFAIQFWNWNPDLHDFMPGEQFSFQRNDLEESRA